MTIQKSTTTFAELGDPLTAALHRLIEKDDDRHPFVIVETVPKSAVFVQFCGARDAPLCYDCPPLGVFNDRCVLHIAVDRGIEGLRTQGVQPDDGLQIIESEDRPRGGIRDLFRRLREAF
jgi:hypothetical protein